MRHETKIEEMGDAEFAELIQKIADGFKNWRGPTWEQTVAYGMTHGPDGTTCRVCGKDSCGCWKI